MILRNVAVPACFLEGETGGFASPHHPGSHAGSPHGGSSAGSGQGGTFAGPGPADDAHGAPQRGAASLAPGHRRGTVAPHQGSDALIPVDVILDAGRIASVTAASSAPPVSGEVDGRGGILVPAFVDMHTHLDKGHIWPRRENPDGTFMGALDAVSADRVAHWSAEDVRRRMEFSLALAYAHGTAAIRTHIDSAAPQDRISWPVVAEVREKWAGKITLQASSLIGIDGIPDDPSPVFDWVTAHGGIVGAVL